MKILLFGEFSGFMNCLKDGLVQLGHEVFLASNGDGTKDYPSDFRWDKCVKRKNKYTYLLYAANIWLHRHLLIGYDIVLLVDPHLVSSMRFINDPIYKYLIKHNKRVYLSGCGDTKLMFDFWYKSDTKYHSYYEGYILQDPNFRLLKNKRRIREWEEKLLTMIDGYIPIWYEYAEPFRNYDKLKETIRIPIAIDSQKYVPNLLKDDKVVFYHGVTRECKGTRYIRAAFEKMSKEYGEHAEFIIAEKLPFAEYMRVIERANVIVDDANSFSVAMNGLFSMLKGKVVMGGAEPIANNELGIQGTKPVFNINPDPAQICETIKYIIDNRHNIERWGEEGRKFVEKYHNSVEIAKKYESVWRKDLENYQ